jgi:hypothetical protein
LPLSLTQKVDCVELRIILVEFFPNLSSSHKAEYPCFIFSHQNGDIVSQCLLLPTLSSFFFVQGGQKDVGDDTDVTRLPRLDLYVCNSTCVFDFGFSDHEIHGIASVPAIAR